MKKISGKSLKKNVMHVLGGTVLTEDFVQKNARFIITLFILIVLYISNRYSCIEKMSQIERLQKELQGQKYESQTVSAKLISVTRSTTVKGLVDKHNLGLESPKVEIYKIEK